MVFITTVKNIEDISWLSVLLAGKTGVPGKNPPTCRKSLSNIMEFTSP